MLRLRRIFVFILINFHFLTPIRSFATTSSIQWRTNLTLALEESTQKGLPVLGVFYMSWCGPSQYLLEDTLQDQIVANYVNRHTIPIKFDGDLSPDLFKKYGVYNYPSVLILRPNGEEVDRIIGAGQPATEMLDAYLNIIEHERSPTELLAQLDRDTDNFEIKYKLLFKYARRSQINNALMFKTRVEIEHPQEYPRIRAEALFSIAIAYFLIKNYDEAISYFQYIIEQISESDHKKAYNYLALSYWRSQRPEQALNALEDALRVFPSDITFYDTYLRIANIHGINLQRAIELGEFGRTIALQNYEKAYLCFLLANVYKATNNANKAREVIEEAISLDPQPEYIEFRDGLIEAEKPT